jgi:hypothetical protein
MTHKLPIPYAIGPSLGIATLAMRVARVLLAAPEDAADFPVPNESNAVKRTASTVAPMSVSFGVVGRLEPISISFFLVAASPMTSVPVWFGLSRRLAGRLQPGKLL